MVKLFWILGAMINMGLIVGAAILFYMALVLAGAERPLTFYSDGLELVIAWLFPIAGVWVLWALTVVRRL